MNKSTKNRLAHWYGMKKIKVGQKVTWISKEDKNGWALGLALGERTLWLRHLRVPTHQEVKRIIRSAHISFPLKNK